MIEVRQLSFAWSSDLILDDISFSVSPGNPVAITGANGSGKSTLLRVIAGLSVPISGTVIADGSDIFTHPIKYRRGLGYLPERAPVENGMTVAKYLNFRARLKGEQARKIRHRVEETIEICSLAAYEDVRIELLSRGLAKRVALAEVFLLRPRYVVLDDPFAGLDAKSRDAVCKSISSFSTFASVIVAGHEIEAFRKFTNGVFELAAGRLMPFKSSDEEGTVDSERS
jgi:ABC-2 type transport system ATP-binding protein